MITLDNGGRPLAHLLTGGTGIMLARYIGFTTPCHERTKAMLERTSNSWTVLNDLIAHDIVKIDTYQDGEWTESTDRGRLYEAAINALIEQARGEGFDVQDGGCITLGFVQVHDPCPADNCEECCGCE